jgi:hypothetical protein
MLGKYLTHGYPSNVKTKIHIVRIETALDAPLETNLLQEI